MIHILTSDKVDMPLFFSRHEQEQLLDKNFSKKFCCFEILLQDNELPTFSSTETKDLLLEDVKSYNTLDLEILEELKDQNTQVKNISNKQQDFTDSFEIEHFYMDFTTVIIGHKLH
jgi:hypothetical protein